MKCPCGGYIRYVPGKGSNEFVECAECRAQYSIVLGKVDAGTTTVTLVDRV